MTRNVGNIETFIAQWLKDQLEQEVDSEANFATLGMDSLDAVRFTDDLAEFIGVDEVPVSLILDHPTARELAQHLAGTLEEAAADQPAGFRRETA
jgi:acyl carrier protein